MKITSAIAALLSAASTAMAATYSYTQTWQADISQSIAADANLLSAHVEQGMDTYLDLPYFVGSEHPGELLVGVSIQYHSPIPGHSNSLDTSVRSGSGNNTFSSVTVSVGTSILSDDLVALFQGVTNNGQSFTDGSFIREASASLSNVTVVPGTPVTNTLNRSFDVTQFTTSDVNIAGLFNAASPSTFSFDVYSYGAARYTRQSLVNTSFFDYAGSDNGSITVTYITTVPEPSAALLALLPGAALLSRRRRA